MVSPACVISKQIGKSDAVEIHSVPCKIAYSGPAQVSGYFKQDNFDGRKRAAFRGHGLEGVKIDLPSEYELSVLKKRVTDDSSYDIESRQRSFTLWEWDREAGERSAVARALSQLKVAQALADD